MRDVKLLCENKFTATAQVPNMLNHAWNVMNKNLRLTPTATFKHTCMVFCGKKPLKALQFLPRVQPSCDGVLRVLQREVPASKVRCYTILCGHIGHLGVEVKSSTL